MLPADPALVSPENPAFEERRNAVDSRHELVDLFGLAVQHRDLPPVPEGLQPVVPLPTVGVDETSNTLLVSAEGENLMENVKQMIETLDEAAKPLSSVSVVKLQGGVDAERVREVLAKVLGETSAGARPQPSPKPRPPTEAAKGAASTPRTSPSP